MALISLFIASSFAQNTTFRPELFELSPFGGGTFYKDIDVGPEPHLTTGSVFGGRVTENLWQHFGLEQSVGYNSNQFRFDSPVPGVVVMNTPLDTHVLNANIDGLFYFTRRGSRIRPFLAGGAGGARFSPTQGAIDFFKNNSIKPINQVLRPETRGQYNYGGGVKLRVSNWLGARVDARSLMSRNPTFGMPTIPNGQAYIPNGNWMQGLEATAGLVFLPGGKGTTPLAHQLSVGNFTSDPAGALAGAPGITAANMAGLTAGNSGCSGGAIRVTAMATDSLGHDVVYHWTVNGQPTGGNVNTLIYTPTMPGLYRVELQIVDSVTKKPAMPIYATPATIYVRDCAPPHQLTVNPITSDPASAILGGPALNAANSTCSASATQLAAIATDPLGHALVYRWTVNGMPVGGNTNTLAYTPPQPGEYRVELQVTDTDSNAAMPITVAATVYARDCTPISITCSAAPANPIPLGQSVPLNATASGPQGTIAWTVSEGGVTNAAGPQTTFNSATVAFPVSPQVQTKTVNATATVTGGGQTASCTIPVRVTSIPPVVHYGDIVFAQASARVNNAAKRILIERLYPQLAGPYQGYTLLMVGHRDGSEPAARQMDRRRVLNTAAVLSANRDTCKDIELSRMRADWVGTANTEYKQTAAASSVTERTADRINPNDRRAQNRRVELWLIPPSASMPGVVREVHPLPAPEMTRLGCPR